MLKPKTIWALVVALLLTPFAIGVNAEPPTWAKQKKTDMMKEAKPSTGPGMEGGKYHAKPKGKAYGVHGTQPSKAKGEEAGETTMMKKSKEKDKAPDIDNDMKPSAEKMKGEAGESMMKKGKGKAKGKSKEKKMK